ncbi:hypothetical protein AZI11_14100 (plasmid) [Levilactobacillus brevis]|uniref:bacteriocin n=1 Tax=Levilactobacillus brevis TaxID=1580 RepID=UPI000A201ADC|nr:bacteriocin [Levilactobacillus brevis]ARN94047.1 hypothetical protein AZI11_14100 [Levilactobacillus brevis]ARN96625.1 hypothetical protein AZI12_14220 [Levilactobacillus brevis]
MLDKEALVSFNELSIEDLSLISGGKKHHSIPSFWGTVGNFIGHCIPAYGDTVTKNHLHVSPINN